MRKFFLISILILGISLFIDVSAKEIIINGVSYDDSIDIEGDGFLYDANFKILYLDGYDGGIIGYREHLEIRVSNTNIINGNGSLIGIDCSEVSISGNGTLKINEASIGINSNRVQIHDSSVLINRCNVGIMALKEEIYFYQSKVIIKECNLGIYGALNMCFNYANVNILECHIGIRRSGGGSLSLNGADLYIKTQDYCLDEISVIDILNSRVVLKSDNLAVSEKIITISEDNVLYVCNDLVNYLKEEEYQFYPTIKVASFDQIDSLLTNDTILLINLFEDFVENDRNNGNFENKEEELEKLPSLDEEVSTSNEYTENEYPFSDYEKVEIINPSTFDEIFLYLSIFGLTILGLGVIGYCWRKCE